MCLIYVYRCLKSETDSKFLPYIPVHYQTRLANAGSLIVPNYDPSILDTLWAGEACQQWNLTPSNILELPII